MRQSARRIAGAIGGIVFVTICVCFSLFGGITHETALANGTLIPTTWIYLPYVSKQAPLVPTATLTPTATEASSPTATATSTSTWTSTPTENADCDSYFHIDLDIYANRDADCDSYFHVDLNIDADRDADCDA